MLDKRHFTVVQGNKENGLFIGTIPSIVAKKVVNKLSKGDKKVIFELREITQGSKKKVYGPYEGVKRKLKEPRKVGDRVYKYESIVKKIEKRGGEEDQLIVDPVVYPYYNINKNKGEIVHRFGGIKIIFTKHKKTNGESTFDVKIFPKGGNDDTPMLSGSNLTPNEVNNFFKKKLPNGVCFIRESVKKAIDDLWIHKRNKYKKLYEAIICDEGSNEESERREKEKLSSKLENIKRKKQEANEYYKRFVN